MQRSLFDSYDSELLQLLVEELRDTSKTADPLERSLSNLIETIEKELYLVDEVQL